MKLSHTKKKRKTIKTSQENANILGNEIMSDNIIKNFVILRNKMITNEAVMKITICYLTLKKQISSTYKSSAEGTGS